MTTNSTVLGILMGLTLALSAQAQDAKPPAPPRIFKNVGDGANVVAATFLGGSGHEWLSGGGIAPDGTVVVVGNVIGPEFDIAGVSIKMIGLSDLPKPGPAQRVPVMEKGKPKLGKDGSPEYERPSWRHAGVTAFIARLAPDMKSVVSVSRFPWGAGAATDAAVGPDGQIYIAGRATDGVEKASSDFAELPAFEAPANTSFRCDRAFVARLSDDASKVLWVRHVRGPCASPTVQIVPGKGVRLAAGNLFSIDPSGKLLATFKAPGGMKSTTSVNPVDGGIVVGGEHHWPTGREPWRCPTLNLHSSDGTLKYQFYDWGGPYVGLNNCRQVSDSVIRFVTHDPDGGILFYAWSDGGNSVMTTEPFDVRSPAKPKGLGMTAAGAGVLSCAYLIDLDSVDHHVRGWTFWSATAQNGKPNSIWVQTMMRASDSSVAVAGHGAWGVWQTANKLSAAEPTGEYVSVFSADLSQLRFCSVMPGAGAAEVSDGAAGRGAQWGIATSGQSGKARVLFVGSAEAGRMENGHLVPTPTVNSPQGKFGGGWCDGYAVLIDLPAAAEKPTVTAVELSETGSARFERAAKGKDPKRPARLPEEGTVFHFLPDYPKHVTADVELRTRDGTMWPSFLYGRPVEGKLTFGANGLQAALTVACDALCQPMGDQRRRVIGELVKDPKSPPSMTFKVTSLSAVKTVNVKYTDRGQEKTRSVDYHEGKATLEIAGKSIQIAPRVTISYSGPKDGAIDEANLSAFFSLSAKELGLTQLPASLPVDVRVSLSGTTRTQAPPKAPK